MVDARALAAAIRAAKAPIEASAPQDDAATDLVALARVVRVQRYKRTSVAGNTDTVGAYTQVRKNLRAIEGLGNGKTRAGEITGGRDAAERVGNYASAAPRALEIEDASNASATDKIVRAGKMFGTDSPQYRQAVARFGAESNRESRRRAGAAGRQSGGRRQGDGLDPGKRDGLGGSARTGAENENPVYRRLPENGDRVSADGLAAARTGDTVTIGRDGYSADTFRKAPGGDWEWTEINGQRGRYLQPVAKTRLSNQDLLNRAEARGLDNTRMDATVAQAPRKAAPAADTDGANPIEAFLNTIGDDQPRAITDGPEAGATVSRDDLGSIPEGTVVRPQAIPGVQYRKDADGYRFVNANGDAPATATARELPPGRSFTVVSAPAAAEAPAGSGAPADTPPDVPDVPEPVQAPAETAGGLPDGAREVPRRLESLPTGGRIYRVSPDGSSITTYEKRRDETGDVGWQQVTDNGPIGGLTSNTGMRRQLDSLGGSTGYVETNGPTRSGNARRPEIPNTPAPADEPVRVVDRGETDRGQATGPAGPTGVGRDNGFPIPPPPRGNDRDLLRPQPLPDKTPEQVAAERDQMDRAAARAKAERQAFQDANQVVGPDGMKRGSKITAHGYKWTAPDQSGLGRGTEGDWPATVTSVTKDGRLYQVTYNFDHDPDRHHQQYVGPRGGGGVVVTDADPSAEAPEAPSSPQVAPDVPAVGDTIGSPRLADLPPGSRLVVTDATGQTPYRINFDRTLSTPDQDERMTADDFPAGTLFEVRRVGPATGNATPRTPEPAAPVPTPEPAAPTPEPTADVAPSRTVSLNLGQRGNRTQTYALPAGAKIYEGDDAASDKLAGNSRYRQYVVVYPDGSRTGIYKSTGKINPVSPASQGDDLGRLLATGADDAPVYYSVNGGYIQAVPGDSVWNAFGNATYVRHADGTTTKYASGTTEELAVGEGPRLDDENLMVARRQPVGVFPTAAATTATNYDNAVGTGDRPDDAVDGVPFSSEPDEAPLDPSDYAEASRRAYRNLKNRMGREPSIEQGIAEADRLRRAARNGVRPEDEPERVTLQGVGSVPARRGGDIRPGDRVVYNYGGSSPVIKVEPVGKGSVRIWTQSQNDGPISKRTVQKTTLVAWRSQAQQSALDADAAERKAQREELGRRRDRLRNRIPVNDEAGTTPATPGPAGETDSEILDRRRREYMAKGSDTVITGSYERMNEQPSTPETERVKGWLREEMQRRGLPIPGEPASTPEPEAPATPADRDAEIDAIPHADLPWPGDMTNLRLRPDNAIAKTHAEAIRNLMKRGVDRPSARQVGIERDRLYRAQRTGNDGEAAKVNVPGQRGQMTGKTVGDLQPGDHFYDLNTGASGRVVKVERHGTQVRVTSADINGEATSTRRASTPVGVRSQAEEQEYRRNLGRTSTQTTDPGSPFPADEPTAAPGVPSTPRVDDDVDEEPAAPQAPAEPPAAPVAARPPAVAQASTTDLPDGFPAEKFEMRSVDVDGTTTEMPVPKAVLAISDNAQNGSGRYGVRWTGAASTDAAAGTGGEFDVQDLESGQTVATVSWRRSAKSEDWSRVALSVRMDGQPSNRDALNDMINTDRQRDADEAAVGAVRLWGNQHYRKGPDGDWEAIDDPGEEPPAAPEPEPAPTPTAPRARRTPSAPRQPRTGPAAPKNDRATPTDLDDGDLPQTYYQTYSSVPYSKLSPEDRRGGSEAYKEAQDESRRSYTIRSGTQALGTVTKEADGSWTARTEHVAYGNETGEDGRTRQTATVVGDPTRVPVQSRDDGRRYLARQALDAGLPGLGAPQRDYKPAPAADKFFYRGPSGTLHSRSSKSKGYTHVVHVGDATPEGRKAYLQRQIADLTTKRDGYQAALDNWQPKRRTNPPDQYRNKITDPARNYELNSVVVAIPGVINPATPGTRRFRGSKASQVYVGVGANNADESMLSPYSDRPEGVPVIREEDPLDTYTGETPKYGPSEPRGVVKSTDLLRYKVQQEAKNYQNLLDEQQALLDKIDSGDYSDLSYDGVLRWSQRQELARQYADGSEAAYWKERGHKVSVGTVTDNPDEVAPETDENGRQEIRMSTPQQDKLITALTAYRGSKPTDVEQRLKTIMLAGRLDWSPKHNWVEDAGGLPKYIEDIALALIRDHGFTRSRAIATAISRLKVFAATGKPDTKAKAVKALAEWEALKAKNRAKKVAKAA